MVLTNIAFRIAFDMVAASKPKPRFAWPKSHRLVIDDKDHYPIKSLNQARNALSRVMQHEDVPDWFDGNLAQLRRGVITKVKELYPSIDIEIKPKSV